MSSLSKQLPLVNFDQELKDFQEEFNGIYSPRKKKIIYGHVKSLLIDQFKQLLDFLINKGGYLPSPEKFEQAARPFVEKNISDQKSRESEIFHGLFTNVELQLISKAMQKGIEGTDTKIMSQTIQGLSRFPSGKIPKCKHCNDSGYVWATHVDEPWRADLAFNCFCEMSANDKRFQTWGSRFSGTLINKNMRGNHESM